MAGWRSAAAFRQPRQRHTLLRDISRCGSAATAGGQHAARRAAPVAPTAAARQLDCLGRVSWLAPRPRRTCGSRRAGWPILTTDKRPAPPWLPCAASRSTRLSTATLEAAQASTRLRAGGVRGGVAGVSVGHRKGRVGGRESRYFLEVGERKACAAARCAVEGPLRCPGLCNRGGCRQQRVGSQASAPAQGPARGGQRGPTCRAPPPGRSARRRRWSCRCRAGLQQRKQAGMAWAAHQPTITGTAASIWGCRGLADSHITSPPPVHRRRRPPWISATSWAASASVTARRCDSSRPGLSGRHAGGAAAKRGGRRPNSTSTSGAAGPLRCASPPRSCRRARVAAAPASVCACAAQLLVDRRTLRASDKDRPAGGPVQSAPSGVSPGRPSRCLGAAPRALGLAQRPKPSPARAPSGPPSAAGTSLRWPSSRGAAAHPAPPRAPPPLRSSGTAAPAENVALLLP